MDQDPDETSAEQRAVTARLAAEPDPVMPDDVAARLQEVLRREAADRAGAATPLAGRRDARRRRSVVPLLAAAAVTVGVVAVGGTVLVQQQGGGGDAAQDSGAAESAPGAGSTGGSADDGGGSTLRSSPEPPAAAAQPPVEVDDLAEVPVDALPTPLTTPTTSLTCSRAALDAGDATRPVTLRGQQVWLVVTGADPRRLTALSCVDVPDGQPPVTVESADLR